jgi:hypothetical protein
MKGFSATEDEKRRSLQLKYDITAWFYDILDYPWERQYRHWQPQLVADIHGEVLELGGKFLLLEMVYSKIPKYRRRPDFLAPLVEKIYGARFDRNTLENLKEFSKLKITNT